MSAGEVSLGLIGLGRWGRKIAATISTVPGVKLAAAASRNPHARTFVPDGCRIRGHWRDLVEADDLQGVIIATPPATHASILIAAAEAGKPVLVEKPLVSSREEAAQLRARMEALDATILVDHIHLFHPVFQALQREAAALGPLRAVSSGAGKDDGNSSGLSLLWEWAPHDLAMCLALAPGAAYVTAANWLKPSAGSETGGVTIAFSLTLAGSAQARVELSSAKPRHRHFAATYDDCTLVYRDEERASLVRLPRGEVIRSPGTPLPFDEGLPLRAAIASFADAIIRRDHGRDSFELGLRVVDLIADIEDRLVRRDH